MDTSSLSQSEILRLNNDFAEWNNSYLTVIDSVEKVNAEFKLPLKNHTVLLIVCIKGSLEVGYDMSSVELVPRSIMVLLPGHLIRKYHPSDDFEGFMISSSIANLANMLPLMSRILVCSLHYKENPTIQLDEEEFLNQVLFRDLLKHKLARSKDHLTCWSSINFAKEYSVRRSTIIQNAFMAPSMRSAAAAMHCSISLSSR